MADDIRALSATLARDPSSLQYVDLAEALRKRGKAGEALQVVMHGLGRHPEHADGYDCLARIHTDRGELNEARAAWERALAIVPEHPGALKGIGFLFFRQGDSKRATDALEHAVAANPGDEAARRALAVLRGVPGIADSGAGQAAPAPRPSSGGAPRKTPSEVPQLRATAAALRQAQAQAIADAVVQRSTAAAPSEPGARATQARNAAATTAPDRPPVFAGLEGATADMLLLDAHGLVMAGGLKGDNGADVSELAAAALAGVSGEASRTSGYLKLGQWGAIVAEADGANVVLAPVGEGALLMLRRDKSTPVGLALRIAERARRTAAQWLEATTR